MKLPIYCLMWLFVITISNTLYAQPSQKPNIIFILSDDIGFDVLTVNGGQSYSTPNIDSMTRHGMNFTHCESSPLCHPSRSMLLTGNTQLQKLPYLGIYD